MTRSRRRFLAWTGILGIVFAQAVATAHACTPDGTGRLAVVPQSQAGHCAGGGGADASPAPASNACEVQCSDGVSSPAALDLPSVALSAMAVTTAPAVVPFDHRAWGRSVLAARSASPPPLLQYGRLLI